MYIFKFDKNIIVMNKINSIIKFVAIISLVFMLLLSYMFAAEAPSCNREKQFTYTSARAYAYLSYDGTVGRWLSRVTSNDLSVAPYVAMLANFTMDGLIYKIVYKADYSNVSYGEYKPSTPSYYIDTETYSYYSSDGFVYRYENKVGVTATRIGCFY